MASFQVSSGKGGQQIGWSTGLLDCCSDIETCCLGIWCPCVMFGRNAEIIDRGTSSCCAQGTIVYLLDMFTYLGCCYTCTYRKKLRKQYGLDEDPCGDCLVHCFCGKCALCQEYRELRNHGFDMTIRWEGNVER
ncbi:Plant cadmium resistance 2 [Quillaja saponaria]|uniref:Plant cadmium resistance 2 n=1 Tax=Quillaja saponaria TaxID=32244 RepID=A0AAD7PG27_QUISA|nr:Plant cadmium resistance 2 [Quillaja saponaria]